MRVPLEWLLQYCDPGLGVADIEQRLTMTGTKVEAIHHHGVRELERFVVGHVLSVEPHPDADRLRICEVDLGQARADGPATIVCGAPNVAAGQDVAVAMPGAVMPDGSRLKAAKLRGVPSEGMILAEDELAIGAGHAGIIVLDGAHAPGRPLAQVLPIATEVIELEVTPNRPDCLGVYGVARELHAATGAPLAPAPWREDPGSAGELKDASVEVSCPDLCPRFTARVFEQVRIAPSPSWLAARLIAAGQRPINNVVDITNYVMLLSGQPLHAFDLDRVAGRRLTVRRAREGERMVTLDGQERTLSAQMIVIDDAEGPTSLAGVMGGGRSEVSAHTTRVLMEVANWHGPSIHDASWQLGLRSEASSRFEKGLAPEQCMDAQAVAAQLMMQLCGARLLPGTIDVCEPLPPRRRIRLRSSRLASILGVPVSGERQAQILRALDFDASEIDGDLEVTVPPQRRQDVSREADLIEEVARIDGLERLPASLPARRGAYGLLSPAQRLRRRAVDALVGRGLYETVGWTFASPTLADRLGLEAEHDWRRRAVALENPLSEEQSLLRTGLIGCLLDAAARNVTRGAADLSLFELGTVFLRDGAGRHRLDAAGVEAGALTGQTGVLERTSLAVLLHGACRPAEWRENTPRRADFYAAKGVLEALGAALRVALECRPPEQGQPFLHPGRCADLLYGGRRIGWIGELHPRACEAWELDQAAALELDLGELVDAAAAVEQSVYSEVSSFPALRRDLAVVVPAEVAAARVESAVAGAVSGARALLEDVRIFDVYSGPQVGEGRKSLALSLSFRAADRTLADADVEPALRRIVQRLGELGGELRG